MMLRFGAALVALGLVVGCGGSASVAKDPNIPKESVELYKQLGDLLAKVKPAAEAGDLSPLFAPGSAIPKNPKDYAKYSYGVGQIPTATGDVLLIQVAIGVPNAGDPFYSAWRFSNQGGEWKLMAAPLPSGHTDVRKLAQNDRD